MKLWLLLFCLAGSLGCSKGTAPVQTRGKPIGGSTTAFAILKNPTQVEASALTNIYTIGDTVSDLGRNRIETRLGPVRLSPAMAKNISDILCDPVTYEGDWYGCDPIYGIRLKFTAPQGTVEALLCMQCDNVAFSSSANDSEEREFEKGRPQIVKFLKTVFPDDQIIQALKENHH